VQVSRIDDPMDDKVKTRLWVEKYKGDYIDE